MSVKTDVLQLLELHRGEYLSGGQLAQRLYVSRTAVWKAIRALQEQGYPIEAQPHRGYCLPPETNILSPQSLQKYWDGDCPFTFEVYPQLPSTKLTAKEAASQGAPEGLVVLAREQTAGRGRLGRQFYSPSGTGLYMSLLLRPRISASDCLLITTAAAVATASAIEKVTGWDAKIKWVNDVFCDGHKVCGILTEASFDLEGGSPEYAICGIGVNLCPPEGGFPAELQNIAGALFDEDPPADICSRLAAEILKNFWGLYQQLPRHSFLEEYRRRSLLTGRSVLVLCPGRDPEPAVVLGIEDDFRLKVRMENCAANGREEIRFLSSGEVSIRL